jgi:copper transport protein
MLRAIAAALIACCAVLHGPGEAQAHASLIASEPADGAVLRHRPSRLTLRFSEPVSATALRLVRPGGTISDLVAVPGGGETLAVVLPSTIATGTHVVSWRVISADGHPVAGSLVFSIGARSAAPVAAAPGADVALKLALWLARVGLSIGLFVGVGGALFAAWIGEPHELPRGARRAVTAALALGIAADVLSVGLQGLDVLAAPSAALATVEPWAAGLRTSYGATAGLAAAAIIAALVSLGATAGRRAAAAAATVAVGAALAASGHAATGATQWLTRPSVFLHGLCIAFWIGALVPLRALLGSADAPRTALVVRRFSRAAVPAVIALVLTGASLAAVELGSIAAFWTTSYGAILGLKLIAFVALLALAAANRLVFTPMLARGGTSGAFRRTIAAELALAAIILGLAAGWRFTPPPGRAAEAQPQAAFVLMHGDTAKAEVTLAGSAGGGRSATVLLLSEAGTPLVAREVTVAFANEAAGVEWLERPARPAGDGLWRVDDIVLPLDGTWQVRIDALVTDFHKLTLEDEIELRP